MLKIILLLLAIPTLVFAVESADDDEIQAIKQKGFRVIKESNGNVIINAPNLAVGQKIIFVRIVPELEELETISQGNIKRSTDKLSLVELDREKIEKFPKAGDYAVFMGEPKKFIDPPQPLGKEGYSTSVKVAEDYERGYAQLGFITNDGSLLSTSTTRANSYKNITKYTYKGLAFAWHPEFLPNYGIEYKQVEGPVPVIDYYEIVQPSSFATSQLRLSYRNQLGPAKIRWKIFLQSSSSEFKTLNGDEYVLASKQTALGLGGLVGYEFNEPLPLNATAFYGQPGTITVEAYYEPNLIIADSVAVSRGTTSTGSHQQGYAVSYTHLFYIEKIPWFKRFFIEIKYATSETKLSFQGKPKNPTENFYEIPENGEGTESEKIVSVNLGLRFEDWFGASLKPRSK
jgi:hypothetical protein